MSERSAIDVWNRRLPLYAYLNPILAGRRILEVGCGLGVSADFLIGQGAGSVVGVDSDGIVVERARSRYHRANLAFRVAGDAAELASDRGDGEGVFDVVVVPEGTDTVRREGGLTALKKLLSASGRLIIVVESADRRGSVDGVGYYELSDAMAPVFPAVRMLGQTPFLGFGIAEFDGASEGLRIESSLVQGGADGASEEPTHYIAIGGPDDVPVLGYALVQIPFAPLEAQALRGAAAREEPAGPPPIEPAKLEEAEAAAARARELAEASGKREAEAREAAEAASKRTEIAERAVTESGAREQAARDEREAAFAARDALQVERQRLEAERDGALGERDTVRAEADAQRARAATAQERAAEIQRKLEDALGQTEGAVRVARVQGEEIEELRGRLRRAAEDRGDLENEIAKVRRALSQADEAVAAITRRTAEEMEALGQRLAAGIRSQAELDGLRDRLAEMGGLRQEADALRARVTTADERAGAAERRLEEALAALRGREDDEALASRQAQDLRAQLAQAEQAAARERDEAAALGERVRGLEVDLAGLQQRAASIPERDERIARLEIEKQELGWRVDEQTQKLAAAEARAHEASAKSDAGPALAEALASRDRAVDEFGRAAAAHVEEATRLRTAAADQAALVSELEETLAAAEAKAAGAAEELDKLRRGAGEAEEADRARRSRLAELEGKLLRLEHEAEAHTARARESETRADDPARQAALADAEGRARAAEAEAADLKKQAEQAEASLRADISKLEQKLAGAAEAAAWSETELRSAQESARSAGEAASAASAAAARADAAAADREAQRSQHQAKLNELEARIAELTAAASAGGGVAEELAKTRAALEISEEQLWGAKEQIVASRERVGVIESDLARLRSERDAAESARQREAVGARRDDQPEERRQRLVAAVSRLDSLEADVAGEVERITRLEAALAAMGTALAETAVTNGKPTPDPESMRRALEQKDEELQLALMDVDRLRGEYEEREAVVRRELEGERSGGVQAKAAADDRAKRLVDEIGAKEAEVILLHTTIANHRRRAAKLREELDGFRSRSGSLSGAEVSGFLEEIGRDLADFEK